MNPFEKLPSSNPFDVFQIITLGSHVDEFPGGEIVEGWTSHQPAHCKHFSGKPLQMNLKITRNLADQMLSCLEVKMEYQIREKEKAEAQIAKLKTSIAELRTKISTG